MTFSTAKTAYVSPFVLPDGFGLTDQFFALGLLSCDFLNDLDWPFYVNFLATPKICDLGFCALELTL